MAEELNATQKFRENMSRMPSEEMSEAAEEGFRQKAEERNQGRPQLPKPDEERAEAEESANQERLASEAAESELEDEEAAANATAREEQAQAGEQADAGVQDTGEEAGEAAAAEDEEDPEIDIGNGQTVRFSELVKGGMRQADYTRKTQELAEQRRQFETERTSGTSALAVSSQRLEQMTAALGAKLSDPKLAQELEQLRQTDPGEYAARMQEIQQQHGMVRAAQTEQDRIFQEQRQAEVPRQRYLLGGVLPEFEGNKFDAAYKLTGEYALGTGGLSPEEWSQLVDHRHVAIVEKARRYDALTSKTSKLPRKLAKLPRSVRPGAASELKQPGHAEEVGVRDALANQEKEGGNIRSTENAFLALEKRRRSARR